MTNSTLFKPRQTLITAGWLNDVNNFVYDNVPPDSAPGQVVRAETEIWVTDSPFNADNTGETNTTSAIQAAINSLPDTGGIVVVANGLYLATNIKLHGTSNDKTNVVLKIINAEIRKPPHSMLTTDADRKSNVIEALYGHGHQVIGINGKVTGNRDTGGMKPPYCTKHVLGQTFSSAGRVFCTSASGESSSGDADDRIFVVTATGAGQTSSATNISVDLGLGYVTEVTSQPYNETTGAGYVNAYEGDNEFAFRAGIYFNGMSEAMQNVVVDGVDVSQTIYGGILKGAGPLYASLMGYGTDYARVQNCYVHDCTATCIGGGAARRAIITNNVIGWTTSSGIRCDAGSHYSIVSHNQINTNNIGDANGCISIYKSDYVSAYGNKGTLAIIGLSSSESDGGVYADNEFYNCGTGISIYKMNGGTVTGNFVRGNLHAGMKVSYGGSNTVTGNHANENSEYGFWFLSTQGIACSGNTSYINVKEGFRIDDTTQSTFTANVSRQNGVPELLQANGFTFVNSCSGLEVIGNRAYDGRGVASQDYGVYSDGTLQKTAFVGNRFTENNLGSYNLNGATGNIICMETSTSLLEYNGNTLLSAASGGTLYLGGPAGSEQLQIGQQAGAVNTLVIKGGANGTSTAPSISTSGSSTDCDIRIVPGGAGLLRYGTKTSTGDVACNGYVTIKTADGTTVKLMTTA